MIEPAAAFLPPDLGAGQSSPTLERAGVVLPLRPEMLPDLPPPKDIPVIQPRKTRNGITTLIREDRALPRVDVIVMVRAGSIADPQGSEGLADLTAECIRAGGSASLSPAELDDRLESMGSSLEVSGGPEAVTFQLFALASNAESAFATMSELIQNPRFDPAAMENRRGVLLDSVLRQEDDPASVLRRTFRQVVYGGGHPLGRFATTASITRIGADQIQDHYRSFYRPDKMIIGITGDISEDDARALIARYWDNWTPQGTGKVWPTPVADKAWDTTSGVVLMPKRTQQTQIRVGHIGLPRKHPDRYAVTLLNTVFGTGGFSSRLMDRVRSLKGLAYGAGGAITSDEPAGLFFASAATQARTTIAALREILDIIKETSTGDITAEELETAKRDLTYSFLAGFNTPTAILQQSMTAVFNNEDEDYLTGFLDRISAVTLEEVNAAARAHMHPDRLKIVLVGFERAFDRPLDSFGSVTRLNADGSIEGAPTIPLPPEGRIPVHNGELLP